MIQAIAVVGRSPRRHLRHQCPRTGDAVRALGLLAGGVRPDRRTLVHGAGVDVTSPPASTVTRSGPSRAAPGPPSSRRPGCTASRGTGTRTTAEWQLGTRQPRCGHFWYRATRPAPCRRGSAGEYTASAFGSASGGYAVIHCGPTGRRRSPRCADALPDRRRLADLDGLRPEAAVGGRPEEGDDAGHAERADAGAISATVARLKNCRRLTPMASGSGGTHGTGAEGGASTGSGRRACSPARSASSAVSTATAVPGRLGSPAAAAVAAPSASTRARRAARHGGASRSTAHRRRGRRFAAPS